MSSSLVGCSAGGEEEFIIEADDESEKSDSSNFAVGPNRPSYAVPVACPVETGCSYNLSLQAFALGPGPGAVEILVGRTHDEMRRVGQISVESETLDDVEFTVESSKTTFERDGYSYDPNDRILVGYRSTGEGAVEITPVVCRIDDAEIDPSATEPFFGGEAVGSEPTVAHSDYRSLHDGYDVDRYSFAVVDQGVDGFPTLNVQLFVRSYRPTSTAMTFSAAFVCDHDGTELPFDVDLVARDANLVANCPGTENDSGVVRFELSDPEATRRSCPLYTFSAGVLPGSR